MDPADRAGGPDPEVLDLDLEGPTRASPPRLSGRGAALLIGGLTVLGLAAAVGHDRVTGPPSPAPSATPSATAGGAAVEVTGSGGRLLPEADGWVLYGRGEGFVVRVEPGTGRVTRTAIPPVPSTGPVSFVAGGGQAIVRPLDPVPAYQVTDGELPRRWAPGIATGGPIFPGPEPDRVWVQADSRRLRLVGVDGALEASDVLTVPREVSLRDAIADATGYVAVPGDGGWYRIRPEGPQRITTGSLIGAGPAHWLVHECDATHRCATTVVDRRDGSRKPVPGPDVTPTTGVGPISPDGSSALVHLPTPLGWAPTLLDLATGGRRSLAYLAPSAGPAAAVWSPDGRWLLVTDVEGRLRAVDPRTGVTRTVDAPIPPITQMVAAPVGG